MLQDFNLCDRALICLLLHMVHPGDHLQQAFLRVEFGARYTV